MYSYCLLQKLDSSLLNRDQCLLFRISEGILAYIPMFNMAIKKEDLCNTLNVQKVPTNIPCHTFLPHNWHSRRIGYCHLWLLKNLTSLTMILKVQSWKYYNNKYMIVSTQITNTETFGFIPVLAFKLLNRKVVFINKKEVRNQIETVKK